MSERTITIHEKQVQTFQLNRVVTENEKNILNRVGGSIEWIKEEMFREFINRLYQAGVLKFEKNGDKFILKLTVITPNKDTIK